MSNKMLFMGNANPMLAEKIASYLELPMGKATVDRFSDGEIQIEVLENVRGRDVFICQPTCTPSNDHLMELIIMADAMRRASASRITAVVPYFGYARQDRRVRSARVPITAKVIADMMATSGISRVLTVDLHSDQIQGFFHIPVDNVYATPIILEDIQAQHYHNVMIVSPDVGGVIRARALAKRLNDAEMAIIDKRRPEPNQTEVLHVIGDVDDHDCLIVDDIVDTAGTLCTAAAKLKEHGANKVIAYVTHPVLSGKAIENISHSNLDALVVTNTIPLSPAASQCDKIRQLCLAEMLAQTIQRINEEESVSEMFVD